MSSSLACVARLLFFSAPNAFFLFFFFHRQNVAPRCQERLYMIFILSHLLDFEISVLSLLPLCKFPRYILSFSLPCASSRLLPKPDILLESLLAKPTLEGCVGPLPSPGMTSISCRLSALAGRVMMISNDRFSQYALMLGATLTKTLSGFIRASVGTPSAARIVPENGVVCEANRPILRRHA